MKLLKYILILHVLVTFSCKDQLQDRVLKEKQNLQDSISKTPEGITSKIKNNKFETIIFEECEYLIYKEQSFSNNKTMGFMSHKGNCKNPIHCRTK